jgi:integrase
LIFNYHRPYTKIRANISLGAFPDVSLAEARRKGEKSRELLAIDIDPKEQKEEDSQQTLQAHLNTLESVAKQWLDVKKSKVSADHAGDIWRSLELHMFPTLGKQPIHTLSAPQTIATLNPISAKGSLETVKRLCQRINEVMVFALNTGVIETNPLVGISDAFETPKRQHLPTLKPDQLPTLMKQLTTASIKLTTRCLIEWQLHTMVRPSEAAGARWDEIDEKHKQWNIPAERMKRKRAQTIPLSPQALALLEVVRPLSGNREHIFPGDRNPRGHAHAQTANMAIQRMTLPGKLVAHGFRSLASTTLNEQGFDADIIEAALAHVDTNEVRRAYNRAQYLERRRVMMEWWSEHIEKAATGNMSLASGKSGLRVV